MTIGLAFCMFMVVSGGIVLGWLARWNLVLGDEAVEPLRASDHVVDRNSRS